MFGYSYKRLQDYSTNSVRDTWLFGALYTLLDDNTNVCQSNKWTLDPWDAQVAQVTEHALLY